ncbi:hypothetical protein QQS21_001742 [Conoideocrella luteorostrata]|uniref:TPR-like protein n=1 Tax=Conoideocrella luteorostrata TaxID=1105319 RepID=A0AAJ0G3B5_9HYPO|nr:hypothetical protein QQS21_001742 [Conoideocrella luteorostrata]
MNTITFDGPNTGLQVGINHGPFSINYSTPERPETPPHPSILIPFGRDRNFVNRGETSHQIKHNCCEPGSWTALVGLGGVGWVYSCITGRIIPKVANPFSKSQLAIEHAYQAREQSPAKWVFWVHASNAARFEQSFREIAECIKVPGRQDPKANIFQLVHDWLRDERKGPWVIILDNVDNANFLTSPGPSIEAGVMTTEAANSRHLKSYIPPCQHGSVLITSRSRRAARNLVHYNDIIEIKPMSKEEALQLFSNMLGRSDDKACMLELASALEFMPLAIVQAAAFIQQRRPRSSVQKYLDEFRHSDKRKTGLLGHDGEGLLRDREAKNSILITWQISFDYIRETKPSAADLLSLMSFCDRQGIPDMLLRSQDERTHGYDTKDSQDRAYSAEEDENNNIIDDGESTSDEAKSSCDSDSTEVHSNYSSNDRFESDIVMLRDFSFIIANDDKKSFEMHRLVQLAMLEWLRAHEVYEEWRHRFLVRLCEELPGGEYENWTECQVLFPHAQLVAAQRPVSKESMKEWATVLYKAAWYALKMGKGIEAEDLSVKALKARKKTFDKQHNDVVNSLAMVALAYGLRGRWSEAEQLEVQVMETRKKKLGQDHPDTLTSMANLATTFWKQGRWKAAEELEVQVMETRKTKLGQHYPSTLTSMANLASTFWKQGRWEAAEELQVQVMETSKTKLGQDHPDTLTSMVNLASTFRKQGRWEAAEELEVQVMETRKTKLGQDHPDTLTSMANLASTFWKQGLWEAAEELQVQVMETRKTKLGQDHPDTLTSMANLASTFWKQGLWEAAEELQVQVMETSKTKLGQDHPDTLTSMANLASTYRKQGRWKAAEELHVQVMETRKTKLGQDHPSTLMSMNNLAWTYWSLGRNEEAIKLMRQCIQSRRDKLGTSHPDYLSSVETLASWEA